LAVTSESVLLGNTKQISPVIEVQGRDTPFERINLNFVGSDDALGLTFFELERPAPCFPVAFRTKILIPTVTGLKNKTATDLYIVKFDQDDINLAVEHQKIIDLHNTIENLSNRAWNAELPRYIYRIEGSLEPGAPILTKAGNDRDALTGITGKLRSSEGKSGEGLPTTRSFGVPISEILGKLPEGAPLNPLPAPRAITNIRLSGYKSIRDLNLRIDRINVLIGANGAGKSNLLSWFHLLRRFSMGEAELAIEQEGGPQTILHSAEAIEKSIHFGLEFEADETYIGTLMPTADGRLIFSDEYFVADMESISATERKSESSLLAGKGYLHTTTPGMDISTNPDPVATLKLLNATFEKFRVYHLNNTGTDAPIRQKSVSNDNLAMRDHGENLGAMLARFDRWHRDRLPLLEHTISRVVPGFQKFLFRRDKGERQVVEFFQRGNERPFSLWQLSDGALRFVALATILLEPELTGTLIIDEPELGLHPNALGLLAGLIRSASSRAQIIVATQSPTFLNHFSPENIIVVEQRDGQSLYRRLDTDALTSWLEDYSLSDLWDMNVLDTST
jgi:predicted ATPase